MKNMKNNRNLPPRPPFVLSPEKKKLIISLALVSLVSSAIYFGAAYGVGYMEINDATSALIISIMSIAVPVAFWIAFAGFLAVFLIYNKAFTRRNITADMLPRDWSAEQKESYIFDGKRRIEKSKWMLYIIIPLLVPIALEALYIFTLPLIQNLFGITTK